MPLGVGVSVWFSPVKADRNTVGVIPLQGCASSDGPGASLACGEAATAGSVEPGPQDALGSSYPCVLIPDVQ